MAQRTLKTIRECQDIVRSADSSIAKLVTEADDVVRTAGKARRALSQIDDALKSRQASDLAADAATKTPVWRRSAGRLLKLLAPALYLKSIHDDGFVNATVDYATDYIPYYWPVKLTAYFLIGPEEWERGKNMTWEERSESFVDGWNRIHQAAERGSVGAMQLESGQQIWIGMKLRKGDNPWSKAKYIIPVPGKSGWATVELEDGKRYRINGYRIVPPESENP